MSADTRIWNRREWDRYYAKESNTIRKLYLAGQMTTPGMFAEKERMYEECSLYVRARVNMYKRGYLTELEF